MLTRASLCLGVLGFFTPIPTGDIASGGDPGGLDLLKTPPPIARNQGEAPSPPSKVLHNEERLSPDPILESSEFKRGVAGIVERARRDPHWYVHLESHGAAWRGTVQSLASSPSLRTIVPEQLPTGNCRYAYIGLRQSVRGRGTVHSDLGLAYNYQVARGIPFITTKDPSLLMREASIAVWTKTDGYSRLVTTAGTLWGEKYYTVKKDSGLFMDATFAPGEQVTVSLSAIPQGNRSILALRLSSDARTVIIRIPRNDGRLGTGAGRTHKVAAATVSGASKSQASLLVESSFSLPIGEYSAFPALHSAYMRTLIAQRQDREGAALVTRADPGDESQKGE